MIIFKAIAEIETNVSQHCIFLSGSYNQDDRLISMFVSTRVYQLRDITTLLYNSINAFLHLKWDHIFQQVYLLMLTEGFSKGYWATLPSVPYVGILKLWENRH